MVHMALQKTQDYERLVRLKLLKQVSEVKNAGDNAAAQAIARAKTTTPMRCHIGFVAGQ
ncbi:hypothetical protein [Xanthomonas albilineans]|uniref:hypothetical protein n=2 Tax=Xanthomonas albilineans TaxID=29447 RepID=UPI0018B0A56A|nr:hypothetical protein [Xanthomonas albilineans]